jgi:hypothetical protein
MLCDELVVDIIYLTTPYPYHLDIDDMPCPECSWNHVLSNSKLQSLEFHSTFSLPGHCLGLSMISTPSMDYRFLLVVSASHPNWVLCFTT